MKFDDIRKKYLDDSIKDEKKETKTESNSSPKRTSSFDDIRKKYGIGNESVSVDYDKGREGWQKYLDDQKAIAESVNQKKNEESFWDKLGRWLGNGGAVDTSVPLAEMPQITHDIKDAAIGEPISTDEWDELQKYTFGELYLTNPTEARKYAEKTNKAIRQAKEEDAIKKIKDAATDNFWSGAGHTIGAIVTAPLGLADYLYDLAMAAAGVENVPDGTISPFEYSRAVTGGISEHLNEEYGVIDESIPIIGGKGWGDVYGLGTSIAQSAASAYTLGGAGTLVSYFGQGAASGVDDALSRGASEEQAILYGTSLGVFEGLAEMIGVDNLFKIGSSSTVKGLIKNILKQAGAEGVEEGITSVLDNIADAWIMQDKSNFNIQLNQYISQGMSESEAKWKVFLDSIEGIAFDTIAGAVSGGVHGGVATSIQTGISNHYASKFYGDQSQTLVDEALGSQFSDAKAVGQKFKDKLDSGKKLSGWNLNELLEVTDNSKLKSAVLQRLGELGETSDVTAVADVIIRQAMGEELSSKDVNILNNSKAGHTVLAEMNKDNIKSGGLADKWAESIGTRRVNPEVYNKDAYELAKAVAGVREAAAKNSVAKTVAETEKSIEGKAKVSESGKTVYTDEKGNSEDVNIKRVVSTDGGIKVELDNGKTVSTSELSFGTQAEAIMYEMVARMEVTPDTANEIIKTFKPKDIKQASLYFSNVALAYEYGKYGYEAGLKNIDLSKAEKRIAFNRGRADAIQSAKTSTKTTNKKGTDTASTKKSGIIFEDGFVYDEATANELQKKGMIGIEVIDKMSSLEVHVYASELQADGTRVANVNGKRIYAPNGYFKDGNKIYIDFYAGDGGEGAMLYTMSHEIVHYIREWNAEGFRELGDFLIAEYGKKGVDVEGLLREQRKALKEQYEEEGKTLPSDAKLDDMAYEELVADAMSDMLTDPKAYEKLAKLKQKNHGLWKKLGEAIKALLDKLKSVMGVYRKGAIVATEASEVRGFSADVYEKLQDLYIKAFVEADANYEAAKRDGVAEKYIKNRDISYNLRAKKTHQERLAKEYTKDASVDLETLMQRYDKIISIWESLGGELNSKFLTEWNNKVGKDRAFTVFKAQAGYKYNVELSSMCKKGVPLFEAIDTIVKEEVMKELNTEVLGKAEKEILYDLLKSKDFEIPCAICYVEQARQREGVIIDAFLNGKVEKNNSGKVTQFKLGWNEVLQAVQKEMKANGVDYTFGNVDRSIATDKYVPVDTTMDAATQEAFYKALKKIANKEITRYNKAEGKNRKLVTTVTPSAIKEVFKGTLPSNLKIFKVLFNDPSSRFMLESDLLYFSMTTTNLAMAHNDLYSLFNSQGGVSGYKTKQSTVVYWGDILGKTWKPSTVRDEGGIRNQSNSDFQMYTLLDQVQMYIDFTAKGYYLQAYTKVLSELKLFGLSRGKINASLIPAVYEYRNADGSIDIEKTRANAGLDKNGNLLFDDIEGINHKEAFMLLEDAEYSKNIGGICIGYSDAHILKLLDDKRVQQIIGFHDKTDDPDKRYRGARYSKNYNGLNEAVNNKDGKTVHIGFNPYVRKAEKKFTFNAKTETYEGTVVFNGKTYVADDIPKLAADMYLDMCREKDYTPAYTDFDFHENYYKLLADFSLYDSEGHYAPHRKVAYNMPDTVPYLDINGKKQYMPTKDYIKAELEKELKVRDSISEALADKSENGLIPQFVKRVNESKQSEMKRSARKTKKDSLGNELSAEQQEYFKDSIVRDEKGNLMVLYHGTTANFNTFKKGDVGFHFGTKGAARGRAGFGKNVTLKEVYLNITNPIVFDEDLGSWDADFRLTKELYDKGILTQAEAETVLLTDDRQYRRTTEAANKKLASVLLEKGYDGIAYSNTFETKKPTTSYIVFNSNQAKETTNKAPTSDPDIRYSGRKTKRYSNEDYSKPITVQDVDVLRSMANTSVNDFTSEDIKKTQKWAYKFYMELGEKSPFFRSWFGDWRAYDLNSTKVIDATRSGGKNPRGKFRNRDTGWDINSSSVGYDETVSHSGKNKKSIIAMQNIDKIIENAVLLDTEVSEYGRGKKSIYTAFMHKFYALCRINGKLYIAKMAVDESYAPGQDDTNKKFYHVRAIEIETASSVGIGESHTPIIEDTVSDISIADLFKFVKSHDDKFNPHSVNPLLLNEDGTPKVFYHGTNADFSVFDEKRTSRTTKRYAEGFYFSAEEKVAEKWAKYREKESGGQANVLAVYLDIKNPLVLTDMEYKRLGFDDKHKQAILQRLLDNKHDGIIVYPEKERIPGVFKDSYNYDIDASVYTNADKYGITDKEYAWWLNAAVNNPDFTAMQVAVFSPKQIKSATDNIGTFNKAEDDIHYSLRGKGGVSDRSLLANALESITENDIEKNKLTQYKKKIALIESEQKKLNEIRAKANELRFTKGRTPAETKTMRELDFEANQIENRISTYDKQLLNLESTAALKNVLEREKKMLRKRLEQKGKEALRERKEKDAAIVKEVIERHTESRSKAIEGRHKTEMRHKVIDLLKRLNKLFKGKKESNVKEDMKETVSTALALGEILFNNNISNKDIVNMGVESVTEIESKLLNEYKDILAKREANLKRIEDIRNGKVDRNKPPYIPDLEKKNRSYDARITKLNKELADVFERERARINKLPVSTLINRLANEYHSLKDSSEEYIKKAYEPELFNKLIDLGKNLGGVTSKDMTITQLEEVYKAFTMIEHTVRNANKYFRNGKYEDLQASADEIMAQIEKLKDAKQISSGVAAKIKSYIWNELTPYYAFDKIGSQALMAYFNDLMKGQRTVATDANEAKLFAQATREKHGYNKWKLDELYEFKLDDGRTFSTTLKHLLSVYAYSKRAQAQAHMEQGGFFHNDKATFRKEKGVLKMVRTDAESYKINVKTLAEIKKALGDKTAYVDEMLDYLTKMGEKGNEVTRVIWGVDIFTEEIYFPLKSKDDFLKKSTETAQAVSLKNDGMTKETIPNASNPIVLEAFDDVWANHVERMSLYHGLVIPIDNLNKVLHYGTWSETQARTVSTVLEGKFTSAATDYLEQFINDLNGGATNKGVSNPFMSFFAKFKKTAVGASLSTVVQQPTAIIRAMSEIDAKYFLGSPNITSVMKKWDELRTYAPIAIIKEIGGFDAGGGKQISTWLNSDTLTGIDKVMNTVDEISMKGAEVADKIGWVAIWEAIKRETKATTNLTEGSQEFFEKCAERFEEVITKTQVYDSTLSRSGFMRSKNDFVKMLTAFMGEPTLSINMMYNAIINAKRGGSKVKAAKTIGCVYIATIAASALASIFYALRDDDEDESYMEKYLQALGGETITDIVLAPITSLPGVKDTVSIFQGWDVERSDMTIFKDLKDAFDGLSSDNKSTYRKVEDFAGAIAAAFGLPVKNILRTGREVYNGFSHAFDDVEGGSASDAFMEGLTGKPTSETSKINKALDSGDTEAARQLISEVVKKKSQKYYEEAQKEAEEKEKPFFKAEALKESESKAKAYVKTSMTSYWKPLYKAAYESGDTAEMTRIRKILYNSGLYGKATDVVKTVGAWLKD